jgi:SAM-dependent methyltransferase
MPNKVQMGTSFEQNKAEPASGVPTRIEYGLTDDAWSGFDEYLKELVLATGSRTICELGAGANPALAPDFVQAHGLDYVILDISAEELAKAPPGYRIRVQDIAKPLTGVRGTYDFVFSKMLAEHVKDAEVFHRNIHALLRQGGTAFHFFPTLYAPPYAFNLLLPERLTHWLLSRMQAGRHDSGKNAKFPAYYHWCRGPTRAQLDRLESVGFRAVRYAGFFGHPGYYKKMPFAERIHRALASSLLRHPVPWLTSFAYAVLEKK